MGGTIIRLVEQGHKVHVAYMTSGNIAVFDHDARRFVDFVDEFLGAFGDPAEQSSGRHDQGAGVPVPRREEARPAGHRRRAQGEGADPGDRGPGGGPGVRHPAGATGVHGPAVLPHRHGDQGPDPPAGHRRHRRPARRGCSRPRSTWPANCPTRTARTGRVPRRSSRRCGGCAADGPDASTSGCTRGRGRSGSRTRSRWPCRCQPGGAGAEEAGDLPAPVAEGQGDVPRRDRPARVLAAGRGPQPRARPRPTTPSACRSTSPWKRS